MSLSIGVIYTAYNTADLVPASLSPWVAARRAALGGNTFKVCAVSVPFEGFDHGGAAEDGTRALLGTAAYKGEIDHAIVRDKVMSEVDARGAALHWLVEQGCDVIWQWDADEVATLEDLERIAAFVKEQPYVNTFRISYRNLVFDTQHVLAEPFTPMRIHRVRLPGGYLAVGFWDDNNVYYVRPWEGKVDGEVVRDVQLACLTVPATVAAPLHHSWLSNERSKRKIAYQLVGRGWPECSFRWDETTDQLAFNEAYYTARGLPLPTVLSTP